MLLHINVKSEKITSIKKYRKYMNKNENKNKHLLLKIIFILFEFFNYLIDYLTKKKNKQKHIYCYST